MVVSGANVVSELLLLEVDDPFISLTFVTQLELFLTSTVMGVHCRVTSLRASVTYKIFSQSEQSWRSSLGD